MKQHHLEHKQTVYLQGGILKKEAVIVKAKGLWVSIVWQKKWRNLKEVIAWFSDGSKKAKIVERRQQNKK